MSEAIHLVELPGRVSRISETDEADVWLLDVKYTDEAAHQRTASLWVPADVPVSVGARIVLCVEVRP